MQIVQIMGLFPDKGLPVNAATGGVFPDPPSPPSSLPPPPPPPPQPSNTTKNANNIFFKIIFYLLGVKINLQ
ncbi:MAG: hypothetical protein Ct9H300mP24_5890 [Candidatus Neomarinimicrobiota bacterium]|nr:MAG: hypothetical protein Ct9H300mP24_5890 [Candidatus Neomarinimicrobiota bacterium]